MRPMKKDPKRKCKQCHSILLRKRFGDRLEDRTAFLKRKFCDQSCMAMFQLSASPSSHFLKRFRRQQCERCGTTHLLGVHHKDSDRSNNQSDNLETLCA